MKKNIFLSGLISGLLTSGIVLPAAAQVTSDGTTNTTVNQKGNNFNILNGIQKGNNLFHSFKEFSIPIGMKATFNNSTDVVNIINRVTGGNISNIDGLIKANGNANLFLINPGGIVFGENASLDIGGSFLGSTAESLLFEDGFEFSAVNPQEKPLLTVSVPVGLQMGRNPGAIINRSNTEAGGLKLSSGKSFLLVGGDISLEGGEIQVPSGHIGLTASSDSQSVGLSQVDNNLRLNLPSNSLFADIMFSSDAVASVSGSVSGTINVNAQNLDLLDGSRIEGDINSEGSLATQAGDININIGDRLFLDDSYIRNRALSSTVNAGNINIASGSLELLNGSQINADTEASGNAGNISIKASDSLSISGLGSNNRGGRIRAVARPGSTGNGGNIDIKANAISILDGGSIAGSTNGPGNAGDLTFDVTEEIFISGIDGTGRSSRITNSTGLGTGTGNGDAGDINITANSLIITQGGLIRTPTRSSGRSGDISINVNSLQLIDGGQINISSQGSGDSGKMEVTATDNITIRGSYPISSEEVFPRNLVRTIFNLDIPLSGIYADSNPNSSGDAGSIQLSTNKLNIFDGGEINVSSQGTGNTGKIAVVANTLVLNNSSGISATSRKTGGGNLFFNLNNLILRNNSFITTSVLDSTGGGGNIAIDSSVITGLNNSDIIANAVEGNGGNIDITTQGIFGLEFRDSLTQESDITASSEFGVNGTVEINNLRINPTSGLIELPTELKDSSQQIATGCSSNTGSTFVATGRGGIPRNPNEQVDVNPTWSDLRDFSTSPKRNDNVTSVINIPKKPAIVEATHFIRNQDGEIELVALENTPFTTEQVAECSGMNM